MKYVLVWNNPKLPLENPYFVKQNIYLGLAETSTDLEKALLMTLDVAKDTLKRMNDKNEWSIWSVKLGLVLDQKDESFYKDEEIQKLKKRLKELEANEVL